jgi:8-oxo-dGTP pyrophosphatase MutT (NUDIX family)
VITRSERTITVAIIQRNGLGNDRILLLQRNPNAYPETSYVDPFPCAWELVGGHVEQGEEPIDATLREVREETGIVLLPADCQRDGCRAVFCVSGSHSEQLSLSCFDLSRAAYPQYRAWCKGKRQASHPCKGSLRKDP